MSSLGQRVRDTISDHPETVVLAFSVCVLFLAITIFLWARRAARMQSTIEELTASRNVLTQLAHRPGAAATDRQATPASRTVYSVGRPVKPAPAPPAAAAEDVRAAPPAPHEAEATPAPATSPFAAAPTAAPAEPPAKPAAEPAGAPAPATAIPVTWRAAEEEVTPAAAAWAATSAHGGRAHVSPFKTMTFAPVKHQVAATPVLPPRESEPADAGDTPAVPSFSFSRPPASSPAPAAPEAAAVKTPDPAPPEPAYDQWESLSRTAGASSPPATPSGGDPAYAAWGEVTATAPTSLIGNGHTHAPANGNHNGGHADEGGVLGDLGTVAEPPAMTSPEPGAGGILLVEDDENVAKIYRIILESKGHTVRHAGDGVAALEEMRRGRPELVLLDVMMPRMNGILFLQSLRAQPELRDVPVVILSNFREPRLVDRAMALGALEYVVKAQTRPELLVSAVGAWIAGERAFTI